MRAGLIDEEAHADDEVLAHALADRLVHHQPETAAVLDRAAELVAAAIGRRREELTDEVRAGEGLDAVEPALLAPRRRLGEVGHDPRDVALVHFPRESPVQCLAHRRRTDGRERRARVGLAPPADMAYLAHQGSAVVVDAPREPLEALDDSLVVEVDLRQLPRGLGRDVGRAAEHGERNPALRLRLVIALIALARHAALGEAAGMARAHDAVLEDEVLQPEGLEQRIAHGLTR